MMIPETTQMETKKQQKTIFFQVSSGEQKLMRISNIAARSFTDKSPLLFIAQDIKAAEFVDKSLWAYPVHSLLPHEFTLTHTKEIICISLPKYNPNEARHIFNLTSEPILDDFFHTIYEFDDTSSEKKAQVSKEKYHTYKEEKFALASF